MHSILKLENEQLDYDTYKLYVAAARSVLLVMIKDARFDNQVNFQGLGRIIIHQVQPPRTWRFQDMSFMGMHIQVVAGLLFSRGLCRRLIS